MNFLMFSFILITQQVFCNQGLQIAEQTLNTDNVYQSDDTNTVFSTGKKESLRFFKMETKQDLQIPLDDIVQANLNFDQRCNQEYADKRIFTQKKQTCIFHNPNIIESKVIKTIKSDHATSYILLRRVYNRNTYQYIDKVDVKRSQKITTITQRMLSKDEASLFVDIDPNFEIHSAFTNTNSILTLTEQDKGLTKLTYNYLSTTDHWLLNKKFVSTKVFNQMETSLKLFFDSFKKQKELSQKIVKN